MGQLGFASLDYQAKKKQTKREKFLGEMDRVVPWARLEALIAPHYAKPGKGRRPFPFAAMLRIYFLQQWYALSDPGAEEALYDMESMRAFTGLELGCDAIPDETTVLNFRHLLERHGDFWVTQNISRNANGGANVAVIVEPLPFTRYAPFYEPGIPLVIPPVRASANQGLDPKLKAISRLNMVLADLEARQADPEALTLLIDEEGNLAELLYGNLFVVRDGQIRTPSGRAILEGVSRATTLELVGKAGLEVREAELQPYDLYTAAEAFLTTTSYCLLPVASLNGSTIGKTSPGPITKRLMAAWNELAGLDIAEQMRTYAAKQPRKPEAAAAAAR